MAARKQPGGSSGSGSSGSSSGEVAATAAVTGLDEFYRIPLTTGEALATLAALKTLHHLTDNLTSEETNTVLDTGILASAIARLVSEMPDFAAEQAERLSGSLTAALLEAGLGSEGDGYNRQADERNEPPFYTGRTRRLLEDAFARRAPVEIEYYVRSRDEWTTRRVNIIDVYEENRNSTGGTDSYWSLRAHCRMRDDIRQFRLDHIRAVRVLDTLSEDDEETELPDPFSDDATGAAAVAGKKDDGATTHGTGAGGRRRRRRRSPADTSSTDSSTN